MSRILAAIAGIIFTIWSGTVSAQETDSAPLIFTYSAGQVELGHIKRFHWKVLEAALERTRKGPVDYRLVAIAPMPVSRQEYELAHENPVITVGVFNSTQDRIRRLLPVRVPLDLGLLGYRVLLIRAADQDRFDKIRSLEDLKTVRFGLLPAWSDGQIMRAADLTVIDGDSYDGLFRMLSAHRFDAFSRGASEILEDFDRVKSIAPGLAIERHMLLHYPLPVYFWFARDEEGRRRADRVQAGLALMIADGSLAAMIRERYSADIVELGLAGRRVFEIPNPLLDGRDPLNDDRLWFRP